MSDVVISVKNVSKSYSVFKSNFAKLLYSLGLRKAKPQELVWALRDINFEIKRGEAVAIIGRNGAGKSSLLEILTGTLKPTEGQVQVNGKVSALLELGSGFDPELTGRENVVLNGLLLGLSKEEVLKRFPEIEAFAEIGDAIDRPIKTYSSGMVMRLAFSVQVLCNPGILIIDEALSVGDFFFQQKCLAYLKKLCQNGLTLLFVSHDMGVVRDFCDRAIFLEGGRIKYSGGVLDAIKHYFSSDKKMLAAKVPVMQDKKEGMADKSEASLNNLIQKVISDSIWRAKLSNAEWGSHIVAVAIYDAEGIASNSFLLGDEMSIRVLYRASSAAPVHVSTILQNRLGQIINTSGSSRLSLTPPIIDGMAIFDLNLRLTIEGGDYSLSIGLGEYAGPNRGNKIDSTGLFGPISVRWNYEDDEAPFLGMYGLPASGKFTVVGSNE